jgi:signal transduction histidine kinase
MQEFVTLINASGQRLLNTFNEIIEISRIETGDFTVSPSLVNIEDLMQSHFHSFKPLAELKQLDLKLSEKIAGNMALVRTDRHKLDRIITNLLNNALAFTSKGGIELGNYPDNNTIVFYVKDSGIGIPANQFEAIFERFVQVDLSLSRKHEGSGIGLSIAKAYVEALDGKIWVQSEVGTGSTFFFSIPYIPFKEHKK